jgi:ankyrin repeat protein
MTGRNAAVDAPEEHSHIVKEDPMTPQEEPTRRLFQAVEANDFSAASAALAAGADPNGRDDLQRTPLHFAAYAGHLEVARLLLDNGADPAARDDWQQTPLHSAAGNGHEEPARLLIAKGADPDATDELQRTPMLLAAARGDTDMVQLLQEGPVNRQGHADRIAKRRGGQGPEVGG